MPPRNRSTLVQGPTFERAASTKESARYVVEIRNAAGASLLLTSVDWTDSERHGTMASILRLLGHKPADPNPKTRRTRSGEAPGAERARQKK
jgi:hypothetical protein